MSLPTYVLRRSVGPWSSGTRVDIKMMSKDGDTVVVRPINMPPEEESLELQLTDLVRRRPMDGSTKRTRGELDEDE